MNLIEGLPPESFVVSAMLLRVAHTPGGGNAVVLDLNGHMLAEPNVEIEATLLMPLGALEALREMFGVALVQTNASNN